MGALLMYYSALVFVFVFWALCFGAYWTFPGLREPKKRGFSPEDAMLLMLRAVAADVANARRCIVSGELDRAEAKLVCALMNLDQLAGRELLPEDD